MGIRPFTGLFRFLAALFGVRHPSPGDADEDLPTTEEPFPGEEQ
jgi:hypothetical protein